MAVTGASSPDLHPDAVLDAHAAAQAPRALRRVRVLDQERRLPVAAVGNQRVVRLQFLADARRLEDALHAQHLLDLVLHRQPVLEAQA